MTIFRKKFYSGQVSQGSISIVNLILRYPSMNYDLTQLLTTSYYSDKNLYIVKFRQILITKSLNLDNKKHAYVLRNMH
jgi:hypothetical protein